MQQQRDREKIVRDARTKRSENDRIHPPKKRTFHPKKNLHEKKNGKNNNENTHILRENNIKSEQVLRM